MSDDLTHTFDDEKAKLRYMVWANTSKNTRRRKVEFDQDGALIRVELTKQQCTDDAAVRIYYTDDDTHQTTMPEQLDPLPLDPPAEPVEEVEPEEEEIVEGDAVAEQPSGEIIAEAKSTKSIKSDIKESIPPQSNKGELDNVDDFEEHVKPERIGLDGKDGIGGVWHIDFLAAPEAPKKQGAWTIKRQYSDELAKVDLKAEHQPNKSIEIVLPKPSNTPADVQLSVGVWNKIERKWETGNIEISEEKDGSIYFTSNQVGDFKFFIDRHQNDDKPLVETWLIRPNEDNIEMFLILQNYKLLFTVHPDGAVSLAEQHEPKMLKSDKTNMVLESLLLDMEEESLFVFPTDDSMQYLDYIEKDDYVVARTVQNMCSVAHHAELKMSPYNSALDNDRLTILSGEKTILCDDEKFYVIEDKYIPPEPPQAPSATSVEDLEADEAFKEELEKYEAKIKADEEAFEPDFEIPRDGETMEATLDKCLNCESTINEQNLTIYKLLTKSKVFNF